MAVDMTFQDVLDKFTDTFPLVNREDKNIIRFIIRKNEYIKSLLIAK